VDEVRVGPARTPAAGEALKPASSRPKRVPRRSVLAAAAGAVAGAAVAVPVEWGVQRRERGAGVAAAETATVPFFGVHQAGIATPAAAQLRMIALDLGTSDRTAVRALLGAWTAAAARLTAGRSEPDDASAELVADPASLTVTLGLGPGFFDRLGLRDRRPAGLAELPAFAGDRLDPAYCGGDLVLQICADDAITVEHAARRLLSYAGGVVRVRWRQRGFTRRPGVDTAAGTRRNLMGHLDGTNNPPPGPQFAGAVWTTEAAQPAWLRDGSFLVVRRIRVDLDAWARMSRDAQERTIGRRKDTGAPLGGQAEFDVPDLAATSGSDPVIPADAHIRLANPGANGGARMYRRGYNYDDSTSSTPDAGLIFCAYQADIRRGFLPVQTRLAGVDALNRVATHVGSAVFAVPPGVTPGGILADRIW
jgi:deferrochelatase/peroxidase EfeB